MLKQIKSVCAVCMMFAFACISNAQSSGSTPSQANPPATYNGIDDAKLQAFKAVYPGDPSIDGSFLVPYTNTWRISISSPTGIHRDMGTWTDEMQEVTVKGKRLLKRIQVADLKMGKSLTVNVFDPKTMLTLTDDLRVIGDTPFLHRNFEGNTIITANLPDPPPSSIQQDETKLERPVFDFYGGLYGILLAGFPLSSDYSVKFQSVGEFDNKVTWVTVHVLGEEEVSAGPSKKVKAWHVESDTTIGKMNLWLTHEAPYMIRLTYVGKNGNTWSFDMA